MIKFLKLLVLSSFLFSCGNSVPIFDAERSFDFLEKQCELGPRFPNSTEIQLCRDFIINELENYGAEIQQQKFSSIINEKKVNGVNIIAKFYPQMSRRILLGAHYDTRPFADKDPNPKNHKTPIIGANDAASGVAVLLEIGKIISQKQPQQFGVDLVFFDLEDSGIYGNNETWCLGSTYFAENYFSEKPEKAIVIDMIGDKNLEIFIESFSYHNSPNLVKEIWQKANSLNFNEFKFKVKYRIYDDHFPLIKNGFNAVDIIDFDFPDWHTLADKPDKCSPKSLNAVGQTLLHIIYGE